MKKLYDELTKWGCDVDEALNRLMGDTDLLYYCLKSFVEDKNFTLLSEALLNNDYAQSFNYAHAIKGVAGNLGLLPIYTACSVVVEKLRLNDCRDIMNFYDEFAKEYNTFKNIMKEN